MENLKYLTYARRSRDDKDSQILSLESQLDELHDYAQNNSLKVLRTFQESQSAHKLGRPIFDELMTEIEKGNANALLVWKFDRLSRCSTDTARILKAFDDGHLLEIKTPFESFKAGENILMLYLHFGLADQYSQQLSSNVKRGIRTKLKLGQYPSKAPLGYRNFNRNQIKNIEPDESASIIRQIFTWYGSGEYSFSQIKNKLNELKIRSKTGKKFGKSELQKIIRNKAYYGIIERNGEEFAGTFEPLISKDLFDKANQIMNSKSRPRPSKLFHAYRQIIRCKECDSMFTAETKHKYYPKTNRHAYYTYYSCIKKDGFCSQKPIKEQELERLIGEQLTGLEFDREEWKIALDLLKLDLDKTSLFEQNLAKDYADSIRKIESQLLVLIDLRTSKEITQEQHLLKKNQYTGELKEYQNKLKNLPNRFEEKFDLVENFAEVILQAQEILMGDDLERKRQLMLSISSNLFILDGKLEIEFKKPFSFYFKGLKLEKPTTLSGIEGSNLRPRGPKPRALPTELIPVVI